MSVHLHLYLTNIGAKSVLDSLIQRVGGHPGGSRWCSACVRDGSEGSEGFKHRANGRVMTLRRSGGMLAICNTANQDVETSENVVTSIHS
jgi:hypothetical protein